MQTHTFDKIDGSKSICKTNFSYPFNSFYISRLICTPLKKYCFVDIIIYTAKSCHATVLPNPRTNFVIIIICQIVHLDFPSSSHRGNRGSVLGSLEGRGTCSTSVGAATRNFPKFLLQPPPPPSRLHRTNFAREVMRFIVCFLQTPPPLGVTGAILVATKFPWHHCTVHFANPSHYGCIPCGCNLSSPHRA